ncbi:MAG: nucleotide exchange factor GrpE [bacterium]
MSKHEGKEKKSGHNAAKEIHVSAGTMKESGEPSEKAEEKQEGSNEEQVAEWNDKYLRLYSEFDNYRKRTLKEKIELSKTASSDLITKLLPILDDFERAIKASDINPGTADPITEGVLLIFNKFLTLLNQQGLEQMKTIGEEFNTDFHEAITNIPAPSPDKKNKILDEVEKGYMLNGKVIRYAKVVVGN